MRTHITLGEGNHTKVLAHTHPGTARTVLTCDHATATLIAHALSRTSACLPAALHPVAVAHAPSTGADATPIQVRRRLLGRFDARRALTVRTPLPALPAQVELDTLPEELTRHPWLLAEHLVCLVADAVADAPAPVVAAARAELAEQLEGHDGIAVPARVENGERHGLILDVSLTAALAGIGEQWWSDQLGPLGYLTVTTYCGEERVELDDFPLVDYLWDTEPVGHHLHDAPVHVINAEAGGNEVATLRIHEPDLRAWVAHHRPADLGTYLAKLDQH